MLKNQAFAMPRQGRPVDRRNGEDAVVLVGLRSPL